MRKFLRVHVVCVCVTDTVREIERERERGTECVRACVRACMHTCGCVDVCSCAYA